MRGAGVAVSRAPQAIWLAPGERRVARRVQLPGAVPVEPEGPEQLLLLAEDFPGREGSDADHLVAVIGVGDHVGVLTEHVEDREAIRGEGADPAGRLAPVQGPLALEPLVAGGQP